MKNKLKVLMCSEASFLRSGFGTYAKEILSRLHQTNKYIVAEFASYGMVNDPRDKEIDWIYYANAVKDTDPRFKEYSSRGDNQFGRWRFEKVLLDFKPDVVIDVRDYWMSSYQALSPLRKFFHWILMPTVDSEPQQEPWIDTFLSADAIFTYSDWGAEVLKKQSSNKINYINTTSPGVDLNVFKIHQDPKSIKQKLGIPTDSVIIGSVMRNQKRKLIPELFSTFRQVLDTLSLENKKLADNLFLYLHTSYPDMGWDIPELLKDNRIANKVIFTYICKNCKHIDSSVFKGPQKICTKCMNKSSGFVSVSDGVPSETLSNIYNTFDLYVQYAICEGFGMPQVEAGACGIPIATVNYSAMCDVIHKLGAMSIEPRAKFKELETKAIRVYPDNEQLHNHIISFLSLPKPVRDKKRFEVRSLTEKYYNWDNIAKIWENYLDNLDNTGYRSDWASSMNILPPLSNIDNINIQQNQNFELVVSMCQNHLRNISDIQNMLTLDMLKDADYGFTVGGPTQIKPFGFKQILQHIDTTISNNNLAEEARSKNIQIQEDFIEYARMKAETK